jgi:hypothetical protein
MLAAIVLHAIGHFEDPVGRLSYQFVRPPPPPDHRQAWPVEALVPHNNAKSGSDGLVRLTHHSLDSDGHFSLVSMHDRNNRATFIYTSHHPLAVNPTTGSLVIRIGVSIVHSSMILA